MNLQNHNSSKKCGITILLFIFISFSMLFVFYADAQADLGVIYHESSFRYTQPPEFDYYDPFPGPGPLAYQSEKGLWGWVNAEIYGGNMWLAPDPADSSRAALYMAHDVEDYSGGSKHVKLYELQGREPRNKGTKPNYNVEPYISEKKAYYHYKIWFPTGTTIRNWRLIWQLCGAEEDYLGRSFFKEEHGPQFRLVFEGTNLNAVMNGSYYSDSQTHRWMVTRLEDIPKDQWVEFVVLFEQGSGFRVKDGTIIVWIDGVRKFERHDLPTASFSGTPFLVWGIGHYGSPIEPVGQVQLFKDVMVTSEFPEPFSECGDGICSSGEDCESCPLYCGSCPEICTDECSSGARQCYDNGYRTCGNYDSDTCREWSSVTDSPSGQMCLNDYILFR
jgi:hypothetical protein